MAVKKQLILLAGVFIALAAACFAANLAVLTGGRAKIIDGESFAGAQTAIVPGAYVSPQGRLCDMLADRVDTAVDLYRQGKVQKILMTGDHGRESYDEVNSMRRYAQSKGVPVGDIFMDHAGFSTYESMYRAREIFQVGSAVVVTQNFHLPRAVYIAGKMGIDAVGVSSDKHVYAGARVYDYREVPARVKAFAQVAAGSKPTFLGPVISISGDGRATHDRMD